MVNQSGETCCVSESKMVKHFVFGVERDIDISTNVFPSPEELEKLEAPLGEHEHGWFDSCFEEAKLHYRGFIPPGGKPKAVVIFLNGALAHSGEGFVKSDGSKTNVALLADVFKKANIALYSFDNYGHGFSEGTRFFVPSWETNLVDYLRFIEIVDSKHKGELTTFIMGANYGGNLTIHAARKIQDDASLGPQKFGGCILLGPGIMSDLPPPPVLFLLRHVMGPLFPKWKPFFMPNPISAECIWKDPEVLAIRREPRLIEMKIGGSGEAYLLGTAVSLITALEEVVKVIPGFSIPFYLAHGTQDMGVKIEGSEYLWKQAKTPLESREFKRVEGGYHDLLSVEESNDLIREVIMWIEKRL